MGNVHMHKHIDTYDRYESEFFYSLFGFSDFIIVDFSFLLRGRYGPVFCHADPVMFLVA